uniref:Uncharacterized protein n=1 Tax=viral metagenome TaxID=1070528 RepID=A0A6H1ZYS3_9ZZZZ
MLIIKTTSRYDSMFQNRTISIVGIKKGTIDKENISVPNGLILCDACNAEITTDRIMLLFLSKRDKNPYGVICENCRNKYHSKVEVI